MTDDRTWWPQGYGDDPAFQVRRQIYGVVTGGDYVRGSAVLTLQHTALRYPTDPANLSTIVDQAVLNVRPLDHTTVEIQWGWPPSLKEDWIEVSLVRSAFGRPSTVNDGQTVFRAMHAAFTQPDDTDAPAPIVLDQLLPPGHFYHYGLFFRVDEVNWVKAMVDSTLLPRDLNHDEYLWNGVPPYYKWTDDNLSVGAGPLRKFLSIFSFELDTAREYIEQYQQLYNPDNSPIRLMRHLGANFGIPYEAGIGDIRYRSLLTRIGHLYETRGTAVALQEMVEDFTKYQVDVTPGIGLSLLPDDSDFYTSIGNWAPVHTGTNTATPGRPVLTPDKVILTHDKITDMAPPPGAGRGSMRIETPKANETANLGIACGDGIITAHPDVAILPINTAIPVRFGSSYGLSVYVQAEVMPITVQPCILWFDKDGQPSDIVSTALGNPVGISTPGWKRFVVESSVPSASVIYLVPYIEITARTAGSFPTRSPYIYVGGVMIYELPIDLGGVTIAPDRYLTLGDPGELIGGVDAAGHPTFDPFLLGAPQRN